MPKIDVERFSRGYSAIQDFINEFRDENFGRDFNPYDKFMIFVELTNKQKLKDWVGWENDHFKNETNKKRFFSWIIPKFDIDDDGTKTDEILPPIIVSHKQVRQLEEIIDDEESLKEMEEHRSFELVLNLNENYSKKQVSKKIKDVENILANIPQGTSRSLEFSDKQAL